MRKYNYIHNCYMTVSLTKKNKKNKKISKKKNKNILKGSGGESFSSKKLNKILVQIIKDFEQYGIKKWFLAYGTLLGIIRDNNCINGDDDLDLIVSDEESQKLDKLIKNKKYKFFRPNSRICGEIKKNNISIPSPCNGMKNGFRKIILFNDEPTIDFYIAKEKYGDYHDLWEKVTWTNVYPYYVKKWKDVKLNLPNDYLNKIIKYYGDDWHTPKNFKGGLNKIL